MVCSLLAEGRLLEAEMKQHLEQHRAVDVGVVWCNNGVKIGVMMDGVMVV